MTHRRKKNSHDFKPDCGSSHMYVPLFFIVAGTVFFAGRVIPLTGELMNMHWAVPTVCVAVGIVLWFVQRRKLRFRTLGTTADFGRFKAEIREIAEADGWVEMDREGDHERFIQLVYHARRPVFSTLDMVTLVFDEGTVLCNVINHPEANRSGLVALFSRCRRGRRLITKIGERLDDGKPQQKSKNDETDDKTETILN